MIPSALIYEKANLLRAKGYRDLEALACDEGIRVYREDFSHCIFSMFRYRVGFLVISQKRAFSAALFAVFLDRIRKTP